MKTVTKYGLACGEVTHTCQRGFIYCEDHGVLRRLNGTPCRKLKPSEIKDLQSGKPLKKY